MLGLSAADAGCLRLEPSQLDESRPLRPVRASRAAVPLPDDKVRRLVTDHFASVTSGQTSDGWVELDDTVVGP